MNGGAMKFKAFLVSVFFVCSLLSGISLAQNKVVVIPLIETVKEPLTPFAPLAAESPPNSAYTDNGDGTVTDNVTGLVWQKTGDNATRTWYVAWDYCTDNDEALPGTGWRLPSAGELMSIVYYSTYDSAINDIAFPGTNPSYYWSATTRTSNSGSAWSVNFRNGEVYSYDRSDPLYVRCARGFHNRQSLFKNNGNGTVTDLATGLTWQRQVDNVGRANNGPATAYCQGLGLAGGGWRLPTIKELRSIVDDRVYGPAIDTEAFPGTNGSGYWSATTNAYDSGNAWRVSFNHGHVYDGSKSAPQHVRCVR